MTRRDEPEFSWQPTAAAAEATAYVKPRMSAGVDLFLQSNEGASASSRVAEALAALTAEDVRRYPDASALRLRLAAEYGVSADQLCLTAGADDALARVFRATVGPDRNVVMPTPSFEMLGVFARWCDARVCEVPLDGRGWPTDAFVDAIDAATGLVVLVSPNNPTGEVCSREDVRRIAAAVPHGLLALDLAYIEFADDDLTDLVDELPNVVVFRTLSKAWGLAGLRVGCAVARPEIIAALDRVGLPYPVGVPSLAAAGAALDRDGDRMKDFVAQVRAEREQLGPILESLGFTVTPSQGNFLFARGPRVAWLAAGLDALGIAIRTWPGRPDLADATRISLPGDAPSFERLVQAVRTVMAPDALLLDVDGVLVDVSGSYREAIAQTCAAFGADVSAEDIRRIKLAGQANNDWQVTRRLLAEAGIDVALDAVTEAFEARYQGTASAPGLRRLERPLIAPERLAAWAADRPIALVTGRPRLDAAAAVALCALDDIVSTVVAMEDAVAKPDPAPVREALGRLGAKTGWMVGDTVDDIRAARAAGALPIGVVAPGDDLEVMGAALRDAGAAWVFERLEDLSEVWP